jgi:hypothetical protein
MDVPDPVGHEVLVRNTVIGLNFVDIYYRRGTLPAERWLGYMQLQRYARDVFHLGHLRHQPNSPQLTGKQL